MSLYKETLMSHFRNPQHKIENREAKLIVDGINPSCGDNITLYANIDNGLIKSLSFTGNGCAISMASADILCELIINKDNPKEIINKFIDMLKTSEDNSFNDDMNKLEVFKELQQYPARRGCALLPWETLLKQFN